MDATPKSKGELAIEELMKGLDPQSDRYRTLASARQFKSSWVELGSRLLQVNNRNLYRQWGFDTFEHYCTREIRIRKPTAQKLTLAYRFMEKEEPELLGKCDDVRPLPDYRSVEVLRQAREEKNFSEEEYDELRRAVVDEDRSYSTVLKRFRDAAAAKDDAPSDRLPRLKGALAAARRLETSLQSLEGIEGTHLENIGRLVTNLQSEIETAE